MSKNIKILVITGGPKKKLDPFLEAGSELRLNVTTASFYDLNFFSGGGKFVIKVGDADLSYFDVIYIRVVGKRLEETTLLVNYLKNTKVRIIDKLYQDSLLVPTSISKAGEIIKLIKNKVSIPPTLFGRLFFLKDKGADLLGFPFVIKSTTGKKGRDVWLPKTREELDTLILELRKREINGDSFFAQKFIKASQRLRILVVGKKPLAAITRPAKWRKRFLKEVNGEFPESKKSLINPIPDDVALLAINAADAVSLEIAGVDILGEDETGNLFVIEANAAPSWKLISKDTGINVEREILKYIVSS